MLAIGSGRLYSYAQQLEQAERLPGQLEDEQILRDLPPIPPTIPEPTTVIERLINENQDVWLNLLTNKFCTTGYDSTAADFNPIYQGYAREDYKYLIEYVRFVNYRYLQDRTTHTSAGLRDMVNYLPKKVDDVDGFFATCVDQMKINKQDLLEDKVSPQVLGYTTWEQLYSVTDDVYSNYVRMIPCVYGWHQIALGLKQKGQGVPGTYFYTYWYSESIKSSSADKLNEYLEKNLKLYGCDANWKKWSIAFRQACLFEIAFFDAALIKNLPKF